LDEVIQAKLTELYKTESNLSIKSVIDMARHIEGVRNLQYDKGLNIMLSLLIMKMMMCVSGQPKPFMRNTLSRLRQSLLRNSNHLGALGSGRWRCIYSGYTIKANKRITEDKQ